MSHRLSFPFAVSIVAGIVLAGCAPDAYGSDREQLFLAMPDEAEGAALYEEHCAACHGVEGRGNGPLTASLTEAPADLTQIAANADGPFPRTEVLSTLDGYTRQGAIPHAMPEFGAFLEGDAVPVTLEDGSQSPVPRPLAALLVYIESLQPPE